MFRLIFFQNVFKATEKHQRDLKSIKTSHDDKVQRFIDAIKPHDITKHGYVQPPVETIMADTGATSLSIDASAAKQIAFDIASEVVQSPLIDFLT